jgi:hypothetical protein
MVGRVTEKDADSGPISPLVVRVVALQRVVQNIDRRTKRMEMVEIGFDLSPRKFGKRGTMILCPNDAFPYFLVGDIFSRKGVSEIDVVLQGCWPERGIDSGWPAMRSMQESRTCSLSHGLNTILCFAVLMMSIDATEGEGLSGSGDGRLEKLGVKQPIVRVVVMHSDAMGPKETFKGLLGCDGGSCIHLSHQVDVSEVAEMVNENSGANVAHQRGSSPMSGYETGSGTDELINADHLAWCSSDSEGAAILILDTFAPPRSAMGLAVGTARTSGGVHISEFAGN